MLAYMRTIAAAVSELVGQWAPVSEIAATRFRPMPWEIDREGNLKPGAVRALALLATRGWQSGAGLGRMGAARIDIAIGGTGNADRFIAFETLTVTTRLIEEAEGCWVLEHRIESDDECARAIFITHRAITEEGRWSFFTPKAPRAPLSGARTETALRQAA